MSEDHTTPAATAQGTTEVPHPERIGPYRILDVLGEGGMAVVYLAEQSEPVKRKVALKILKAGMDSHQVIARFESERQALAVLDHPNIARIFDGGIAENGRPYFVMEWVKGLPVSDYCDDYKLDTRARLELFFDICAAVQHAHNKGLIHRDLKPSNILVGETGGKPQPRIIDFGIAKATSATLTDKTLYTRIGQIIGTPQYMSPEQADTSGIDVDTRSDIYSLGVVLYEMLVGVVPMDFAALGDHAMRSALLEKEASKPSTRITDLGETGTEIARARSTNPVALRRELKGDLDWVVMKAIAKDRARRYETVNALAMDCRRYLRHEPVLARPPSAGYLLARFVRRNRTAVTAMCVVFLALVAGVVGTSWGMLRAVRAEQRAAEEASIAQEVNGFLNEDLLSAVAPSTQHGRGRDVPMREVLDVAAQRIDAAAADNGRFAKTPRVEAAIRTTLGNTYRSLGEYEAATPHLQRALVLYKENPGDQDRDLALAFGNLGDLSMALGRYTEAVDYFSDALAAWTLGRGGNDATTILWLTAQARANGRQGQAAEAEAQLRRALDIAKEVYGEDSAETLVPLSALAILYQELGESAKAEPVLLRVMALQEKHDGPQSVSMIKSMNNLGNVYASQGRFSAALPLWTRALELKRVVLGPEHPSTLNTLANLAEMEELLGNYPSAEALYRDVIETRSRVLGQTHPRTLRGRARLAFVLARTGRLGEAESLVQDVLQAFAASLGRDHTYALEAEDVLSTVRMEQGRTEEAVIILRRVRGMLAASYPDDTFNRNLVAAHLGLALARLGRRDEAVGLWEEVDPAYLPGAAQTAMILEGIVDHLEDWQQSDPTGAFRANAQTWRNRLAEVRRD